MASLSSSLLPSASLPIARRRATASAAGAPDRVPVAPRRPWWMPLFRSVIRDRGGSGDAAAGEEEGGSEGKGEEELAGVARRPGRLTAEKARALRREIRATETWHDAMYHSAIASRLASPDQHQQ